MPITASPSATTSLPPGLLNPGGMANLPGMNLPSLTNPGVDPSQLQTDPNQVYKLLSQPGASLTSTLAPLLAQIFGTQGNLMAPLFTQQGQTNAATAQSDAMARGLTGSSIESSAIQQAYTGANQNYSQYLAGQLNNLVPQYSQAAQFDIGQQRNYQTDLAQAIGQQLASQIQQQQFSQQLNAMLQQAGMTSNAQLWSGVAGGLGSALGGGLQAYAMSDIRLKRDLRPIARWNGLTLYDFRYVSHTKIPWWDLPAGPRVGFLAHEVAKQRPDCVRLKHGYLQVDYPKLFGLKTQEWYRA